MDMRKNKMPSAVLLIGTALLVMSCEKKTESPETPASVERTLTIHFESSGNWVKSQASFEEEEAINNVTLFLNELDASTDQYVPYDTCYSETGDIEVTLPFAEESKYKLLAFANFGELDAIPEVIRFDREFTYGIRMHGELDLDAETADKSALSMSMRRYVNKIIVNSIQLNWSQNYKEPLSISSIYIANAGKDNIPSSGGYYNQDGDYQETDMDEYLYESLDDVSLANGETYSQRHVFYAMMGAESKKQTSLVFETVYSGKTMFYAVPLDLSENICYVLDFIIRDAGNDVPYGEKIDISSPPAIEVIVRTFTAEDWDTTTETIYSDSDVNIDTGWEEGGDIEL